jgi:hypothetical protein
VKPHALLSVRSRPRCARRHGSSVRLPCQLQQSDTQSTGGLRQRTADRAVESQRYRWRVRNHRDRMRQKRQGELRRQRQCAGDVSEHWKHMSYGVGRGWRGLPQSDPDQLHEPDGHAESGVVLQHDGRPVEDRELLRLETAAELEPRWHASASCQWHAGDATGCELHFRLELWRLHERRFRRLIELGPDPSKQMKKLFIHGSVVVAGVLVALWIHATIPSPPAPGGSPIQGTNPTRAEPVDAPSRPDGSTQRTVAAPPSEQTAPASTLPDWLSSVEVIPGSLSAAELATTLSYVGPLIEHATNEVQQGRFDAQSAEDLAAEAVAWQQLELWRTVEHKLRTGDYFIAASLPPQVQPPRDQRFEAFPAKKDGRPVTLGFVFDRATSPNLFDASAYAKVLELFRLHEAARKFNSLSDAERRRMLTEYNRLKEQRPWHELPPEMQRQFPIENVVDEHTLLMRAPPGR